MKNKHSLHLDIYSQYRTQIMGVAAIMILICHYHVLLPATITQITKLGNYGVDIFMFVSGFGMFYSIDNNKQGISSWYKKRFSRILVPYLLISIPYALIKLCFGTFSIADVLLNITTLEYWFTHRGAWFVSAVLPLYLITPFLSRRFKKLRSGIIVAMLISAAIIILLNMPIFNDPIAQNIKSVLRRTPMFFIGFFIANSIKTKEQIKLGHILTAICIALILYFGFKVYTALTIPIIIAIGYIIKWMCKKRLFNNILIFSVRYHWNHT